VSGHHSIASGARSNTSAGSILREAHQPDSRLGGRRAREGGRSQVQHLTLGLTAAPPAGERRPAPPCAPSRVRRRARLRWAGSRRSETRPAERQDDVGEGVGNW